MVDGDRNGNGRRQRGWATATAMVMEFSTTTEMVRAIAMATAMAKVTMTKAGLPLYVPAMCSAMAGATPCLHPHGHKGKCIYQRCVMGVTLLRVFPPFQGGGFLTANHELFFVYFLQLLFSLLSGAQEPCQPINALPPPFLQEPRQPIDSLPGSYCTFCQGKPGQGLQ